jgi:hypothetical protein
VSSTTEERIINHQHGAPGALVRGAGTHFSTGTFLGPVPGKSSAYRIRYLMDSYYIFLDK